MCEENVVPKFGHEHRQTRDTELLKNLFHKFPSPTRVRQQMVPFVAKRRSRRPASLALPE